MQKIVVFDIDNTLYDGTMGVDLLKGLMQKGIFPDEAGSQIINWVKLYKNNQLNRYELFDKVYPLYSMSVKDSEQVVHQKIANEIYSQTKDKLYQHSRELVKMFAENDFLTIALSGSSYEMVFCICEDLGIELFDGARSECVEGVFTGKFLGAPSRSEIKVEYLNKIIEDNKINVDFKNSFAFGDSESERDLFDSVGNPFVFEPHPSFTGEVAASEWTLVDRSNIIESVRKAL